MTCSEASCKCAKFTLKAICSSVGLCTVVVGYVLLGGYVFQFIEGKKEIEEIKLAQEKKSLQRNKLLMDLGLRLASSVDDPCVKNFPTFKAKIDDEEDEDDPWIPVINKNFTGSQDTVDSIKAQNKTRGCLYNLFENAAMMNKFEKLLNKYELAVFNVETPDIDPNKTQEITSQWTLANSVLFATTVITTIGYGNLVPKTTLGMFTCIIYAMVGVPLMLITLASMGNFMATCFRFTYQRCCHPMCTFLTRPFRPYQAAQRNHSNARKRRKRDRNLNNEGPSMTQTHTSDDEDGSSGSVKERKARRPKEIPIYLSLLVIIFYLITISAMFKFWENWGWLKAIYFCFITFSTIGFGDVVPGASISNQDESTSNYKSALCAVSVLFGLAIMSMCFNLMQNTIFSYFEVCCKKVRRFQKDEGSGGFGSTRTETVGNESVMMVLDDHSHMDAHTLQKMRNQYGQYR